MDVNVKVLGSDDPLRGNFLIRLANANETVGDIKKKIADHVKVKSADAIRLVFSGQFLSNDLHRVGDLELGPSTFLNALIADVSTDSVDRAVIEQGSDQSERQSQPRHWRSRFFVYCKNYCKELTPGKLRVRCSMCESPAVLVKKEPNSWNDVLTRGSIRCQCLEHGCRPTPSAESELSFPAVEFYFKCARCSNEDGVVPLPQVKCMRKDGGGQPCSVCGQDEEDTRMVTFSCDAAHAVCLDCFMAYAMEKLERRSFVMHPTYGYTLPCPEPRCRGGYIADGHHFRLLGDPELYQKYHRLAAEIYLLGEGGLYCPRVDCGEAFIADSALVDQSPEDNGTLDRRDRNLVLCPKCGWAFCFYCRSGASECRCATLGSPREAASMAARRIPPASASDEVKSITTIRWTTKSCPKCRAPTEKNEGCNHMTCAQCSFDWCWDCEKRWTEDCQWNHWFD